MYVNEFEMKSWNVLKSSDSIEKMEEWTYSGLAPYGGLFSFSQT